jgi:hypothetical protein
MQAEIVNIAYKREAFERAAPRHRFSNLKKILLIYYFAPSKLEPASSCRSFSRDVIFGVLVRNIHIIVAPKIRKKHFDENSLAAIILI